MNEIEAFTFPATGQTVRSVMGDEGPDDGPWFVAADVCAVLNIGNARQAVSYLDEDEVRQLPVITNDGSGRTLHTNLVNEPGLYSLILRSRKPEAKAFKRWVTHEVLPEIRRTGTYSVAPAHPLPRTFAEALRELADAVEQRDAAEARIAELEPAADAWDTLAEAKGDYSLREAAQILNRDPLISTGQNRLARYLRDIGWTDNSKQPYQREVDNGRLVRRATSYPHPHTGERESSSQVRITPKGLKELRRRMAGQQPLVVIDGSA